MKTMKKLAESLRNNFFEVVVNSEWIKVVHPEFWPDLAIYVLIEDLIDDDELTFYVHLPASWNSVIKSNNLNDVNKFIEEVKRIINNVED